MKRLVLLPLVVAVIATSALGAVLGYTSSAVYVIGLGAVLTGLVSGAAVSVVSLMLEGAVGPAARWQATVAILAGWAVLQVAEDRAFQGAWAEDFAAARQAAAGVDPAAGIGEDELVFFAEGADRALSREMTRVVGFDGPMARWLFRADAGVRLIGPASGGRGIAVGRVGAILWALLEVVIAVLVARAVLRRVQGAVMAPAESPHES